jgi:hypothetical protein
MAKPVRWFMVKTVEVLVMRNAETTLTIIRERGKTGQLPHRDPRWATDADARITGGEPQGLSTGEPCAVKVASTVRRGADGKGRSRFLVSALAGQAHELRHKTYLASRLPDHYSA